MTATRQQDAQHDCALVLVAKRPRPGVGKQRVAATLGQDIAYALSQHLFDCALEDLALWQGPSVICIAGSDDSAWAQARMPEARVITQSSGNLGRRLNAATHALAADYQRQLFIGCDAPTITPEYLQDCATALMQNDVVLGRARDGGVVAMGTRRGWPTLEDLPWSTDALGQALAKRCEASGWRVSWAPEHADIDEADQLASAVHALTADKRAARIALRAWLKEYIALRHDALSGRVSA